MCGLFVPCIWRESTLSVGIKGPVTVFQYSRIAYLDHCQLSSNIFKLFEAEVQSILVFSVYIGVKSLHIFCAIYCALEFLKIMEAIHFQNGGRCCCSQSTKELSLRGLRSDFIQGDIYFNKRSNSLLLWTF